LRHSIDGYSLIYNACSMRAHGMEPKAQCNGRRRACTGYELPEETAILISIQDRKEFLDGA